MRFSVDVSALLHLIHTKLVQPGYEKVDGRKRCSCDFYRKSFYKFLPFFVRMQNHNWFIVWLTI